jgi:hypothetical protein
VIWSNLVKYMSNLIQLPNLIQLMRNTFWPINTLGFASFPIVVWSKALINPHSLLGIALNNISWKVPDTASSMNAILFTVKFHLKAWEESHSSPTAWVPPSFGFQANFDDALRPSFSVVAAVLSDHFGFILAACTKKLPRVEALVGEAMAALAARFAANFGCSFIHLKGDCLLTVLAINKDHLVSGWPCAGMFILSFFSLRNWLLRKFQGVPTLGHTQLLYEQLPTMCSEAFPKTPHFYSPDGVKVEKTLL